MITLEKKFFKIFKCYLSNTLIKHHVTLSKMYICFVIQAVKLILWFYLNYFENENPIIPLYHFKAIRIVSLILSFILTALKWYCFEEYYPKDE